MSCAFTTSTDRYDIPAWSTPRRPLQLDHQQEQNIANYFGAEPDYAIGMAGIADHLKKLLRGPGDARQIIAHLEEPLEREAVQKLASLQSAPA